MRRRRAGTPRRGTTPWAGGLFTAAATTLLSALCLPSGVGAQVMDDHIYTYVAFDEMEYQPGLDSRPVEYRGQGWIGGDYNRFWVMARGEQSSREGVGEFEGQALYSRTVSDYFNAQVGLRLDHHYGEGESATRGLLAAGFGGLAPYWFELRSFLFVSQEGDLSARLEASYELLFTQRLVLEPEIELNAAVQDVPEFGVGSGLNDVELGARMRYEIVRELAPYVGINWLRRTGATADLARLSGEGVSHASFVAGLRWWY